ncbi:MAG: hypothetical protein ACI8XB_002608 [Patiriisocius sp.]|jgi:hypothetical protein
MNDDVMNVPLLNFNNYEVHPVEKGYMVFFFSDVHAARHFEILLVKDKIYFEKDETENQRKKYVFGIKRQDFKKVLKLNDLSKGLHRERTIKNKYFGTGILIVVTALIMLSIIGFFLSNR